MSSFFSRLRGKKDPHQSWVEAAKAIASGCDTQTLSRMLNSIDLNASLDTATSRTHRLNPWEVGYTLVHFAAAYNTPCIDVLARYGAYVDLPTVGGGPLYQGRTPLYIAARNGSVTSVQALLHLGASPRTSRGDGWTVVHAAAGNGHTACLRLLLDATNNADVNAEYRKGTELSNWTPLLRATGQGHVDSVKLLLERGADPDIVRSDGVTSLHWAAQQGHTEAVRVLLAAMSNKAPKLRNGFTPLHESARFGHYGCVEEFLKVYTKEQVLTRDRARRTAFHVAMSAHGHAAIALSMVQQGRHDSALRLAVALLQVCRLLREAYPEQLLPCQTTQPPSLIPDDAAPSAPRPQSPGMDPQGAGLSPSRDDRGADDDIDSIPPVQYGRRSVPPQYAPLPPSFLCPISKRPMVRAVLAADGYSYDEEAIQSYLANESNKGVSPVTGSKFEHTNLVPNNALRDQVRDYMAANGGPVNEGRDADIDEVQVVRVRDTDAMVYNK